MNEKRRHENECFGICGVLANGKEEKGKPESGALHEEPSQWREDSGTPSRTIMLAIWGLEEPEGDEGWGSYEEESEEGVMKETLI